MRTPERLTPEEYWQIWEIVCNYLKSVSITDNVKDIYDAQDFRPIYHKYLTEEFEEFDTEFGLCKDIHFEVDALHVIFNCGVERFRVVFPYAKLQYIFPKDIIYKRRSSCKCLNCTEVYWESGESSATLKLCTHCFHVKSFLGKLKDSLLLRKYNNIW
jgi:hypothetical protein